MLVEADYLVAQTEGLTRDEFVANETLRRAFVRSLEIVGEAKKKGDYELVWDVVHNRIPELRRQIASTLEP